MDTFATVNHFHDFYYLESLLADMTMAKSAKPELQFNHAFERFEGEVKEYFEVFTARFAKNIAAYLWAAALGEARHASGYCEYFLKDLDNTNRTHVYKESTKYPINRENINTLKSVFSQHWSSSGFGGEKWLSIVEAVEMYFDGTLNHAAFIDHAADLQHNGGSAFTKEARNYVGFSSDGVYKINSFLTYKFHRDILRNEYHDSYIEVSFKVKRFLDRHAHIIDKTERNFHWITAELQQVQESCLNWGNETLSTTRLRMNTCDFCEKQTKTTYIYSHGNVCQGCIYKNFTRCENCGKLELDDKITEIDGNKFCLVCANSTEYISCERCRDNVTDWTEINGDYYCEYCKNHKFEYCEKHEVYHEDICEECENEIEHETTEITDGLGKTVIECSCGETLEYLSDISKAHFFAEHPSKKQTIDSTSD